MYPVIEKLKAILEPLKTEDEIAVKKIIRTSEIKGLRRLRVEDSPQIQLVLQGFTTEDGPLGNTRTRVYSIKVRMIVPQSDNNDKNIDYLDRLEDSVINIISSKKQIHDIEDSYFYLVSKDEEMNRSEFIDGENNTLFEVSDYTIAYSRMEEWTGTANIQENTKLTSTNFLN